jgi:signal transduction histidine kinase
MGPLTDNQAKAIHAIEMGSNRLVEMVRHYLNLSRIENNEMAPMRGRLAVLSDVLNPLLDTLHAEIEAKRMQVKNGIGSEVLLDADVNMVREVFENLISNAIKYGREQGNITVRSTPAGEFVEFAVRNEGEGIPEARMGELFQKFGRLNSTESARKQKGTGLGLFITKNIVEAHGGAITVTSESGEWVEFVFSLPAYKERENIKQ